VTELRENTILRCRWPQDRFEKNSIHNKGRSARWNAKNKRTVAPMVPCIQTVPRCVVKGIAWSARTGNGLRPLSRKRAIRIAENRGVAHWERLGQSESVLGFMDRKLIPRFLVTDFGEGFKITLQKLAGPIPPSRIWQHPPSAGFVP
jgi:hypothetical protein